MRGCASSVAAPMCGVPKMRGWSLYGFSHVARDDVSAREQRLDVGHVGPAHRLADFTRDLAVVVEEHLHAELLGNLRDLLADIAETQHTEGLAVHFEATRLALVPLVVVRLARGREDAP